MYTPHNPFLTVNEPTRREASQAKVGVRVSIVCTDHLFFFFFPSISYVQVLLAFTSEIYQVTPTPRPSELHIFLLT
jgi:hypothetical protein